MSRAPTRTVAEPVSIPAFVSTRTEREQAHAAAQERPGFFRAAGDAINSESPIAWLLRQDARSGFTYDPSFVLDDDTLTSLSEGLPEETWERFGDAVSMAHAVRIREQLLEVTDARERLSRLGWQGAGLRIAAAVLDPVGIAAGAATGGLGYAVKGGRVARMLRTGLAVGSTEAALEGYLTTQDPERDVADVIWAGAGGLLLGGAADALVGGDISRAARKLRRDVEYGEVTALRQSAMGASSDPRRATGSREDLIRLTKDGESVAHLDLSDANKATGFYDAAETGKPFSVTAYRTGDENKSDFDRGVFFGDRQYVSSLSITTGDPVFSRTITPANPLVFWSKSHYLETLGKQGDAEAARLANKMRDDMASFSGADRASGKGLDFSEAERYIAKIAKQRGHDAYISQLETEIVALKPSVFTAPQSRGVQSNQDVVRLTKDGEMHFAEQATAAERGAFIDDLIARTGFDEVEDADQIAELRNLPPEEALNRFHIPKGAGVYGDAPVQSVPEGAAVNLRNPPPAEGAPPPFEPTLRAGDFDPTGIGADRAAMTGVRRSFSSILGNSKSDDLVRAGNMYVTDSLLKRGGKAAREGADTWRNRIVKGYIARHARVANENFTKWAKANKVNPAFSMSARENFMAEVARAIRHEPGSYTRDAFVNAVADAQRRLQEEIRQIGVRHAVKDFDRFEGRPTYLTRAWSPSLVNKAVRTHGADAVDDFFYNAIMSKALGDGIEIAPEKARKIGAGLRTKLTDMDRWTDTDRTLNLSGDKSDLIEEVLTENGIDAETIKDVLYGLGRNKADDAGRISVAKHRVQLDETYAEQMADGQTLRVDDLLDNNAERLFHRYANQVVGQSAAQQIYRQFGVENFDALKAKIGKAMDTQGISKTEIDAKLATLELADKHVRGVPLEKSPTAAAWARRMMGLNYLLMSGGFGLAQVPELAGAVASAGWTAMRQQMPEIRRIITGAKNGTITGSELSDFAEAVAGHGSEHFTNSFTRRFADEIDPEAWRANKFDFALHQSNRLASKVSMLEFIDTRARRIAGNLAAQRLVNIAQGRPLSARRLASLGLTEADGDRLTKAIRKELEMGRGIVSEPGVSGRRVKNIRPDLWEDQDAASMLVSAFDRLSRNWVQTNTLGANNPWLTQWQGKILTQFRGFMIQAWEKQFLHRVQMHDAMAFQSAMTTMFSAGIVYIAQQHALSAGREDREKFLEERLTDRAIASAAFQRAGWSSFIPTMIDTGLRLGQRDALFQYGNTGLSRNLLSLDANATSATLNQALRGIGGAIGASTSGDEDFSQQDARALLMLLPFRNVMGVRNVLESIAQQIPEE